MPALAMPNPSTTEIQDELEDLCDRTDTGRRGLQHALQCGLNRPLWRGEAVLSLDRIGADLAMTPIWIGLLSVLLGTPLSGRHWPTGG